MPALRNKLMMVVVMMAITLSLWGCEEGCSEEDAKKCDDRFSDLEASKDICADLKAYDQCLFDQGCCHWDKNCEKVQGSCSQSTTGSKEERSDNLYAAADKHGGRCNDWQPECRQIGGTSGVRRRRTR
eukprot:gnl/MRDRNA2_/MRDRNA2_163838_c0_seq1.p1 gnl/MRDRNA2_/MRDRNA2_163838_c0~~gnl/MRDRNA2_/MRDRNA2_163838_c0_seq1.p1  ORF type:complete len:128 (+),score=16.71 gnl/MRDRNA2_/MRDRNA2_163838_c0_seq1:101-484(+)